MVRRMVLAAVIALVLAGCGGTEPSAQPTSTVRDQVTPAAPSDRTPTPSEGTPAPSEGTPTPSEGTPAPPEGTPTADPTSPRVGSSMLVVGVVPPDTLNLRAGPDAEADIMLELATDSYGLHATGRAETSDDGSTWVELRAGGEAGWASNRFLAVAGRRTDASLPLLQWDGFSSGDAAAAEELPGRVVAWAQERYQGKVDRVATWNYPVGDSAHDHLVVDLLDDGTGSGAGRRLEVFYQLSNNDGSYQVEAVTETLLCRRAVDLEGSCV